LGTILQTTNLTKFFGGLCAVDGVNIEVKEGEIRGLIGPNGSGKSTFLNLICGIENNDRGEIFFNNQEINREPIHNRAKMGISRTFQTLELFKELTVLQNIMIGFHNSMKSNILGILVQTKKALNEEKDIYEQSTELLKIIGISNRANDRAGSLSYGQQRLLEISRALTTKPKLLLLDEPAAGLNLSEINDLVNLTYKINNQGVTIIIVEHRMEMIMKISDLITVLDEGKKIAEGKADDIKNNPAVQEAYLGKKREEYVRN